MTARRRSLRHSRTLRWALRCFPRWARERHGEALLETWEDVAAARSPRAVTLRAAWDLARNGCLLRLERLTGGAPATKPAPAHSSPSSSAHSSATTTPLRPVRLSTRIERVGQDLRFALRRLLREPVFAVTAVLIVGLGIGANTAIFSIVNGALFKPLPYERPEELVRIYVTEAETTLPTAVGYLEYQELGERRDLFADTAFHADATFVTVELDGVAQTLMGEYYSASFFPILGLQPALGRGFLPEDGVPGVAEPVAMLSHSSWQRRFGGDPAVLGSQLRVNGMPVTVVGVGPADFQGTLTGIDSELYLPWGTATQIDRAARTHLEDRRVRDLFMLARLQDGVTRQEAQNALTVMASRLAVDHPASNEDRTFQVYAASDVRSHPLLDKAMIPISGFFMVLVALVLTVSVSNLANLLLAKASVRRREMAMRRALGAQRGQLVGQLLLESTLLAGAGGLLGLGIALCVPRWLVATELPIPIRLSFDFGLDGRVLLFTLLLSLATGLLFGLAPALSASRGSLTQAMGNAPALNLGRGRRWSLREGLIVLQVAVSTLLLAGGALFLHSLLNSQSADPGFETERAVLASLDAERAGYMDEDSARRFWRRYQEQLEGHVGSGRVALTSRVPLGFLGTEQVGVATRGALLMDERPERSVELSIVSPDYWQVLNVPIRHGRAFAAGDDAGAPQVAVVSEALADALWGNAPAVGQRLGVQGRGVVEVIGVAADTSLRRLSETPKPHLYLPSEQHFEPWMTLVVATDRPAVLKETLRRELEALDPRASLFENKTMTEHLGLVLYPAKVASTMLVATGLLALVLASFGLYGMIALAVARRTREVGIRAALGASRGRIIGMVVGEALQVVAVGVVGGLLLAGLALRPLRGLLYGVSTFDPTAFAAVTLILGLVTVLASYLPARRTARIDVVSALKAE